MRRFLAYLGLLLPLLLQAESMPRFKVGTYNVCTSDSRLKSVRGNDSVSPQRLWCNSYTAVGDMIVHMDCDIMGLQEICDSIWNGPQNIRADVAAKGLRYEWILYPNTTHGHTFPMTMPLAINRRYSSAWRAVFSGWQAFLMHLKWPKMRPKAACVPPSGPI